MLHLQTVDQGPAKVVVNSKIDWLIIFGIGIALALLISIPLSRSIVWSLFVLVVLGGLFFVAKGRLLEQVLWGKAEAHFYSWPLTLGSETQVEYVRRRRRGTPKDGVVNGWAAVSCTEIATYSVGTTTYTDKATAYVDRFDVNGQRANGEVSVRFIVHVPVHAGAPSMSKPNNEIKWELVTRLKGIGPIDSDASFRLPVAAVLTDQADRITGDRA